jgi:hypothetical protein
MRKIPIYFIVMVALFISSGAYAIEKRNVEKASPGKPNITAPDTAGASLHRNVTDSSARKDFDDFIDRNSNGIDDRLETKKEKNPSENKSDPLKDDSSPPSK